MSDYKPGRELDRLVGERILGLCWHNIVEDSDAALEEQRALFEEEYGERPPDAWRPFFEDIDNASRCTKCEKQWRPTPNYLGPTSGGRFKKYSTEFSATEDVLEKLIEQQWSPVIEHNPYSDDEPWLVMLGKYYIAVDEIIFGKKCIQESAKLLPHAVCLAALKTLDAT